MRGSTGPGTGEVPDGPAGCSGRTDGDRRRAQLVPTTERTLVSTVDDPTLHPAAPGAPAGTACLQASLLLRRRIHRLQRGGVADEQVLLAVCHLLDALSRGYARIPDAVPSGVERAAVRLADQLQRAERPGAGSNRAESPRAASDRVTAGRAAPRPGRA